ncbi:MAG TPA: SIS domain-containing protein [Candidatus Acidoferrales bacterium]|nr:SIS domain-containing protein [Candidatus Acidoferrales bacterium]
MDTEKIEMTEERTAHPFHLYDAIHQQPALVQRMISESVDLVARAARAAAEKERLWIVGIGSSLYTAEIAEYFFRHLTRGRADIRVGQSFEFVFYPPALSQRDAVIILSHTGITKCTLDALKFARRAGALTMGISGENEGEAMRSADFLIPTCEQEISFAYTKSLTSALARLAFFSLAFAETRGGKDADAKTSLEGIPALMRQALQLEAQMKDLAQKIAERRRIILIGAGPNWPAAREIALKIKETSFAPAEGEQSEQLRHGPFSEIDEHVTLIALLAGGPADERTRMIIHAAGETGAHRIVFYVPAMRPDNCADDWFAIPTVEEWLSPFVFLVPLQLLTYFLALARGTNPDHGRLDQPPHTRARQIYKY